MPWAVVRKSAANWRCRTLGSAETQGWLAATVVLASATIRIEAGATLVLLLVGRARELVIGILDP